MHWSRSSSRYTLKVKIKLVLLRRCLGFRICYCLIGLDAVRFFSTWKSLGSRHGSRQKKIVIIHDGLRWQIIDLVIDTGDLLLNFPLRFKQGNGPVALLWPASVVWYWEIIMTLLSLTAATTCWNLITVIQLQCESEKGARNVCLLGYPLKISYREQMPSMR